MRKKRKAKVNIRYSGGILPKGAQIIGISPCVIEKVYVITSEVEAEALFADHGRLN